MSLGTLETQQDWNELLACCCPMPLCPVPVKVCESLNGHFQSTGYVNTSDPTFKLYKKQGWDGEWNDTETVLVEDIDPSIDGETASESTIDLTTFFGQSYDILYDGQIGSGGGGCPNYEPVVTDECTAVGTSNRKVYFASNHTIGTFPDLETVWTNELSTENAYEVFDVSGTETEEHAAWDAAFSAAIAAWNAAHPSGPTWQAANATHTAWQAVKDEHDAWLACEIDTPGECGDEPPDPGTEPPTTGIDDEPTENYPDCWFKVVNTFTVYAGYWGYNSGGTPAAPTADPDEFADWFELGDYDYPPCPGSGQTSSYGAWSTVPSMLNPGGLSSSYSQSYGFPDPPAPLDYAAWVAEVLALITAQVTFPKPGCTGNLCESSYAVTDAPPAEPPESDAYDDIILDATDSRFQWQIPSTWNDQFTGLPTTFTGTYFKITWNVIEEPTGWDATIDDPGYTPPIPNDPPEPIPQIPEPGRPSRSFVPFPDAGMGDDPDEWVCEWTGPGIAGNAESWLSDWFLLGIPSVPGRRYVANVRFICQPDSPWGTLPQVTGASVTIE